MTDHTSEKIYKCKTLDCDRSFSNKSSLENHIKREDKNSNQKTYIRSPHHKTRDNLRRTEDKSTQKCDDSTNRVQHIMKMNGDLDKYDKLFFNKEYSDKCTQTTRTTVERVEEFDVSNEWEIYGITVN